MKAGIINYKTLTVNWIKRKTKTAGKSEFTYFLGKLVFPIVNNLVLCIVCVVCNEYVYMDLDSD